MKRFLDITLRYGVAALAVGVALGLKLLLGPLITDQSPFLLLAGAVVVGAWFGGLGPGLLATALGTLGANYFFVPPQGAFTGPGVVFLPLLLFMLQGILISALVAALRSARNRAERSTLEARDHQERLRESEERFRLMVDGVKDYAIFMLDPTGHVTTWNDGAGRVVGYRAEEILGRHFSAFNPDEDLAGGHPEQALRAAAKEGRYEEEGPKVREDGSRFWASAVITALKDKAGNLKGFSMVVRDITERKHTDDVLRFLAESGATLTSSLDYRDTLANVARLAVPTLADWCAVDVMEQDGSVERLVVEHPDPEKVALAYELQERYPSDPDATRGIRKVLETGEPDMMAEIPEELMDAAAVDSEHRQIMSKLGLRSYMVVPMVARGRSHGAITLVSAESGRRYGACAAGRPCGGQREALRRSAEGDRRAQGGGGPAQGGRGPFQDARRAHTGHDLHRGRRQRGPGNELPVHEPADRVRARLLASGVAGRPRAVREDAPSRGPRAGPGRRR
jgi:PAS domain S-box-containing protein